MAEEQPVKENIVPEKKKKKKKKLLGFPSVMWAQLSGLNESEYFAENYGEDDYSLLLRATDDNRCAIVKVKGGKIQVEQIKNKPEFVKPAKKETNGGITADTETFLKFGMGTVKPIPAILSGQLKIRGVFKVLRFKKYFGILRKMKLEKKAALEAQKQL
ncbi:SCP2 sterol-binding domain-containing protein [Promethearchaeum syntrophicum]|uniref:SCP2 sterol-binding domain-containing protein n=1 Tax=Promethearchaeum syntrophicum TaxID=2594042 RepID=A0A5B9D5R4_9ARCH|nr:SCP2 sterol-binding domain-containing protein [Candidatus Prometheoarchaeum syntrophicum]QEE14424.1 hypothetical protein DSAG12_00237 [Candidatus Prometheoarchaeum syntrophicum]